MDPLYRIHSFLLDFTLFAQDESFHIIGQLWNIKKQQVLSNDIEIHFVEIPKLVKQWREGKVNPWEELDPLYSLVKIT